MSPLRARMIEDMSLAGLATGTQKIYVQAVRRLAAHYRRSPDLLSEEEVRGYLLGLRQRGVARGTFQTSRFGLLFFYHHTLVRTWGLFGEKGSPRHDRNGCLTRCQRIRSGNSSGESATRFTRPASPSCMRVACASARPPPSRLAPSTGPIRCCASSARATRSGWCRCHSRSSTNWNACGAPIATAAGCSPIDAATHRSTSGCCQTPSPPPPRPRGSRAG